MAFIEKNGIAQLEYNDEFKFLSADVLKKDDLALIFVSKFPLKFEY